MKIIAFVLGFSIVPLAMIAAVIGWVLNIHYLIQLPSDPFTMELVMRALGIPFVPLGAVLGWLV